MTAGRAWGWFTAWAGAGFLLAFSLVSAASIGLFVLPFAGVAVWVIVGASPPRPSTFGLLSGAGLVGLVLWAVNRGSRPCQESGMLTVPPGTTDAGCGGREGLPFLVAGLGLAVAGAALFALARRRGPAGRLG